MVAFLVALLLLIIFKHSLFRGNPKRPPSPPCLPIVGHLHLFRNSPEQTLQRLSSKYGPILYLKLGSKPFVVVSSPSLAWECFTKNDIIFSSRPRTLSGDCLTYNYTAFVWAPYGHLWRTLRRISVTQFFSSKSLGNYAGIREEEARNIISHLVKASGNRDRRVEFGYWFSLLTYNIIMRSLNGRRCVRDEVAGTEDGKMAFEEIREKFGSATPLNLSDFFPVLRWVDYKGVEQRMKLLHKKRDEFLQSLIDGFRGKRGDPSGGGETGTGLIAALLDLQKSDAEFFSDDTIKSLILVMFIGGTTTSSSTMDKATSLLINHPHVLQKLRAEIDKQVGHEKFLEESDLPKLPYLQCVINETLRLYPPAPLLLPRYSSEDCTLGGFHVPRGTTLLVNAWAIHRDYKVWEDPEKFKPERFESMEEKREGYEFLPFGMGRRACPGANMSIRVMCLAIGMVIQCLDLEKNECLRATCLPRHELQFLSQL